MDYVGVPPFQETSNWVNLDLLLVNGYYVLDTLVVLFNGSFS